ncbi:MAG: hypothetical protein IH985_03330 [Planctomycetes bacterium]|nr:hypothetical protein [Planctomycetota bacterium]
MDKQEPDSTQEPTTVPTVDPADLATTNGETGLSVRDAGQQPNYSGPAQLAEHAWKPGQSGNPKGRPKGTGLTDRLRKILERDDGRAAQALVEVAVREALKGDFRFWDRIYDRMDGPVKQQIEASMVMAAKAIDREAFDGG